MAELISYILLMALTGEVFSLFCTENLLVKRVMRTISIVALAALVYVRILAV